VIVDGYFRRRPSHYPTANAKNDRRLSCVIRTRALYEPLLWRYSYARLTI